MIALLSNTLALVAPPAAAGGCDPASLDQALDAADDAFVEVDDKAMSEAVKAIRRSIGCIEGPVPPGTCARIHRARALAAWVDGEEDDVVSWLRAMLHADPRTELSAAVVGEQHRLRTLLLSAEEHGTVWTEAPGKRWLLVDGVRTGAIPVGQPYVVQPLRDDGRPRKAKIVDRWRAGSGRPRAVGGIAPPLSGPQAGRRAMRWAGLGLGVVSAGLYGGAWRSRHAYWDAVEAGDDPRIGRTHTTTNALTIGAVAAVGLGAGALLSAELAF